jgi:hypothetical protein
VCDSKCLIYLVAIVTVLSGEVWLKRDDIAISHWNCYATQHGVPIYVETYNARDDFYNKALAVKDISPSMTGYYMWTVTLLLRTESRLRRLIWSRCYHEEVRVHTTSSLLRYISMSSVRAA